MAKKKFTITKCLAFFLRAFEYRADGRLSQVSSAGSPFQYTYGDNGLLQSRTNPFRNFSIPDNSSTTASDHGRDLRGRIQRTQTTLKSNSGVLDATPVITENVSSWSVDDKQEDYSCWHQPGTPSAWEDIRAYDYSPQRRQLLTESWINSPDKIALSTPTSPITDDPQTLTYTFDGGNAGGLGVRTKATTTTVGTEQKHEITVQDAWKRATSEKGGFEKRFPILVSGKALGAASVELFMGTASLSQVSFPEATVMSSGAWSRSLSLPAGSYQVHAKATHPSGQFTTEPTSRSFTLAAQNFDVSEAHDEVGNVTTRTVTHQVSPTEIYVRTQTLAWDAEGRLMSVTQADTRNGAAIDNSHDFTWSATYDASSRRVQARTTFTGGHPQAGRTLTETSWHDPLVEFLEVGLEVAWGPTGGSITKHERWWKVHGPDLNGGYGGLQGMGGLEAMVNEVNGEAVGFIDDMYGHILGFASVPGVTSGSVPTTPFTAATATFEWNSARFGGHGPLPGHWSPAIADGVATWRTFGWRGKRMEVTGYYHLGARYYNSSSGRFMSADPLGHGVSMSLYDYAGGDPVNFVDPRGRSAMSPGGVAVTSSYGLGFSTGGGNAGAYWGHNFVFRNEYTELVWLVQNEGYPDIRGNRGVNPKGWGGFAMLGHPFPRQFYPVSSNPNLEPTSPEPSTKLAIDRNHPGVDVRGTDAIADSALEYARGPQLPGHPLTEGHVETYREIQTMGPASKPGGERELALISAPRDAVYTPGAIRAIKLGRGLGAIGIVTTGVNLTSAAAQSKSTGDPVYFTNQVVRETGAWSGGILAGAGSGFLYGLAGGSPSGPGAILTGIGGGLVGGYFGYKVGDQITKMPSNHSSVPYNPLPNGIYCTTTVCVSSGTLIKSENGLIPIDEIKAGDKVWSHDSVTNHCDFRMVAKVYQSRLVQPMTLIEVSGHRTKLTSLHLVMVRSGKDIWKRAVSTAIVNGEAMAWIHACEIKEGDFLMSSGFEAIVTRAVNPAELNRESTYNIEVENADSFAVSKKLIFVHDVATLPNE